MKSLKNFFVSAVSASPRLSLLLLVLLLGCRPAALIVPSYIQNVGVAVFKNQTSFFGLETLLTQATIREFQVDGRLPLEDPEKSDLAVRVTIKQYIEEPQVYDTKNNNVLQYRLTVVYDLVSADQRENKTFFEDVGKARSVYYYTTDNIGAIIETKEQAQNRLAEEVGRSIARRVLVGY
jgi:hypothetical protein